MNKRLAQCYSIADLRELAKNRLPRMVFDYVDGGAEDEVTLSRNRDDFNQYELVTRILVDVADIDLSTSILGQTVDIPLIMAPIGMPRLIHHEGEAAVARATEKAGTIFSLSTMATMSIEEINELTAGPKWFQIYVWRDRELLKSYIERCKQAGYHALCLTVDVPAFGQRERDLRNGLAFPPKYTLPTMLDALSRPAWLWHYLTSPAMKIANLPGDGSKDAEGYSVADYANKQMDPSVTWEDVAWMIELWDGPFIIKGILSAEDAKRAVAVGANAVIVSNHGGRQLDHAPATIAVLPEIIDAVAGRAEVILDGGIRRGTDILKALALGANACMIGRPYLYGLAAAGEAGVTHALDLLRSECIRAMKFMGCKSLAELDRHCLRKH